MVKRSNYLTRAYRVVRMLVHLIYAIAVIMLLYRWMPHRLRSRIECRWSKGFLKILNIQVKVQGVIPDLYTQNIMLVANHISWLDVYLLSAVRPARFVSKAEVRAWPVIGWLAHKTGTLFIDRTKRHDTARINDEISSVLSKGGCLAVFPEGTTSEGGRIRPFHASLLQPAIHSQSHLWPAAIRYCHADGSMNTAPAYVNELSFADSLWLVLGQHIIYAELVFMSPIPAHGKTRRELAKETETIIAGALKL